VDAVRARGGKVILHGDSYDDAYQYARQLVLASGATYIPPFDDPLVIAGQGTVGMEILAQQSAPVDVVFIPVGGGGLIAGVAAYIKAMQPHTKIIGVEPNDADAMYQSLLAGERVRLSQVGIFADGVAVKEVGEETFRLCKELVDEVILVDTDQICAAIKDVFEENRSILEPAGALAVAGLKAYAAREGCKNQQLVAIASGANVNFDRLRHVAERAALGEQREAILAVTIPEQAGSFRTFCTLLSARNVTEFNYRYADATFAHVFVGVQISTLQDVQDLIQLLEQNALQAVDLTHNEMAKLHIRHLVGGRLPQHAHTAPVERLYRFEFPERPGALMRFLQEMNHQWNISLFHYRNHGADYGRVLVGVQVAEDDYAAWQSFLQQLGYVFVEESHNPAYALFLA
jgi:threonine dehydratase